MNWLIDAAAKTGIKAAAELTLPPDATPNEMWEALARVAGATHDELAARIAPAIRLRAADLEAADRRATRLVPERLARRFNVVPVAEDDRSIYIASGDPTNVEAEQQIELVAGRRVVFELAAPESIGRAIDAMYTHAPLDAAKRRVLELADSSSRSILLVEDDVVQRTVSHVYLQRGGFAVVDAVNGREALTILGERRDIALVVTDLQMDEMDGVELLRAIRADGDSTLPVLVLTGLGGREIETSLLDAGADDYVRKPIDSNRLVARVRAAVRRNDDDEKWRTPT